MDALMKISEAMVPAGDVVFGWMLFLPTDAIIILIALITSLGIVFVRRWTTDQDLLKRCNEDKARLKELIKQAKKDKDKDALQNRRALIGRIGMKQLGAEGKPLLAVIVPIAFLAVWAFFRIGFYPPNAEESVKVQLYHPVSAKGRLVHILPEKGLESEGGWIKRFDKEPDDPLASVATWNIKAKEEGTYNLKYRFNDKTFEQPFTVGARHYDNVLVFYPDGPKFVSQVHLEPRKLFGIVPGFPSLMLDPWIVGYLIITIVMVFVNKWLFKIE